jgi:hypothetical protein
MKDNIRYLRCARLPYKEKGNATPYLAATRGLIAALKPTFSLSSYFTPPCDFRTELDIKIWSRKRRAVQFNSIVDSPYEKKGGGSLHACEFAV